MIRLRRLLLPGILSALALLANAAPAATPVAAGVRARLVDTPVLRGDFEQVKALRGFKNPLRSRGRFLLARDRGVVWTTQHPFPSTIVLAGKQLSIRQGDDEARPLAGQGGTQAALAANRLLMALLSGRVDGLSEQFTITETLVGTEGWRLLLVPKPGTMAKVFRRIELAGDRHVRIVVLEETSGDRTEIHFLALRDAPATLDRSEARQFD